MQWRINIDKFGCASHPLDRIFCHSYAVSGKFGRTIGWGELKCHKICVHTCSGVRVALAVPMSVCTQPGQTDITKMLSSLSSSDCILVVMFKAA